MTVGDTRWQRHDRCTFPRCDCRGACRHSDAARMRLGIDIALSAPAPRPARPQPAWWAGVPRDEVEAAVGKLCPYCGWPMTGVPPNQPTRDHINPTVRGGANTPANIIIVCKACNEDKGDHTLTEWYFILLGAEDRRAQHVARLLKSRGEEVA